VLVLDAAPAKFCVGDSGSPVLNADGRVVALISGWWLSKSGCSYHVRATSIVPEWPETWPMLHVRATEDDNE